MNFEFLIGEEIAHAKDAKGRKEYRGFIFILGQIPRSRDTSPHGRDALTRAFAWIFNWPYFVPHARDYGGFKVEGGKWKGLW